MLEEIAAMDVAGRGRERGREGENDDEVRREEIRVRRGREGRQSSPVRVHGWCASACVAAELERM